LRAAERMLARKKDATLPPNEISVAWSMLPFPALVESAARSALR
jgi:hypothetical protein